MLGVSWQPTDDVFRFHLSNLPPPEAITKRRALSIIAQLYDPLGWIAPITVSFKIFMQTLWHTGLQWDVILPRNLQSKWSLLVTDLQRLSLFTVPRWLGLSADLGFAELHGFADASERAYAACVYMRTLNSQGEIHNVLMAAKSKVAPLKQVSLPRLELSAAVLLVKLTSRVREALTLEKIACHLWSDSTITLSWIRDHPTAWKTYVANRVELEALFLAKPS